jgi:hypothetical protein
LAAITTANWLPLQHQMAALRKRIDSHHSISWLLSLHHLTASQLAAITTVNGLPSQHQLATISQLAAITTVNWLPSLQSSGCHHNID